MYVYVLKRQFLRRGIAVGLIVTPYVYYFIITIIIYYYLLLLLLYTSYT